MFKSVAIILFNLISSFNINLFGYGDIFQIIPIYYLQFIFITKELSIQYSQIYENFCNFFYWAFYDISIKNINKNRRLSEKFNGEFDKDLYLNNHFLYIICMWGITIGILTALFVIFYTINKILKIKKIKTTYTYCILKLLLVSYCSISTIIFHYLVYGEKQQLSYIISIILVVGFIIGFPLFIYFKLKLNKRILGTETFHKKYGCLYEYFDNNQYKFQIIVAGKQLSYACLLLLKDPLIQNIALLSMELIYFYILYYYNHYYNKRYTLQSIIAIGSTILVSILNFFIILHPFSSNSVSYINILIHIFVLTIYIAPILVVLFIKLYGKIYYNRNKKKYDYPKKIIENDLFIIKKNTSYNNLPIDRIRPNREKSDNSILENRSNTIIDN